MSWFTLPAKQAALSVYPPGCSVIRMIKSKRKSCSDNCSNDGDDSSASSNSSRRRERGAAVTPNCTSDIVQVQVGRIHAVGIPLGQKPSREMMYKFEATSRTKHALNINNNLSRSKGKENNDMNNDKDDWAFESELQFAPKCPIWFDTSLTAPTQTGELKKPAQVIGSYHAPDAPKEDVLYSIKVFACDPPLQSSTNSNSYVPSLTGGTAEILHGISRSQLSFRSGKPTTSACRSNSNSPTVALQQAPCALAQQESPQSSPPNMLQQVLPLPPPPNQLQVPEPMVILQLPLWVDFQAVQTLVSASEFNKDDLGQQGSDNNNSIEFVPPHLAGTGIPRHDCPCPEFPHVYFKGVRARNTLDRFASSVRLSLKGEALRNKYNEETRIWEPQTATTSTTTFVHPIVEPTREYSSFVMSHHTSSSPTATNIAPIRAQSPQARVTPKAQFVPYPSSSSNPLLLLPTKSKNSDESDGDNCSSITEPEPTVLSPSPPPTIIHPSHGTINDHLVTQGNLRASTTHPFKVQHDGNHEPPLMKKRRHSDDHHDNPSTISASTGLASGSDHKRRRMAMMTTHSTTPTAAATTNAPYSIISQQNIPQWFPTRTKVYDLLCKKRGTRCSLIELVTERTGCTIRLGKCFSGIELTSIPNPPIVSDEVADITITAPNQESLARAEEFIEDCLLKVLYRREEPRAMFSLAANRRRRKSSSSPKEDKDDDASFSTMNKHIDLTDMKNVCVYQRSLCKNMQRQWMQVLVLPDARAGGAVIGVKGHRISALRQQFATCFIHVETTDEVEPFILVSGSEKDQVKALMRAVSKMIGV